MESLPTDIVLNIMEYIFEKNHYDQIFKSIKNKDTPTLMIIIQQYKKYLKYKNTITIFYKAPDEYHYKDDQKLDIYEYFNNHKTLNKIKKYCRLSTFGNSTSKQNMDKNIRNSYILTYKNFKTSENLKQKLTTQVREYIKNIFGYNGNINFKKHSINLYTKNSHFNEHIDNSSSNYYIGTLVLLLPSKFTGGELLINKKICKWNTLNDTNILWTFINQSVIHSVNQITSGFRITILYDVTQDKPLNRHSGGIFQLISRQGRQDTIEDMSNNREDLSSILRRKIKMERKSRR